jgi:hypothetical protein
MWNVMHATTTTSVAMRAKPAGMKRRYVNSRLNLKPSILVI